MIINNNITKTYLKIRKILNWYTTINRSLTFIRDKNKRKNLINKDLFTIFMKNKKKTNQTINIVKYLKLKVESINRMLKSNS